MKIKKIKLLKALALTSSLGIVATVPIIVSSCSTTSSNNGSSNGGNGSSNGGNGSSNGGNSGTDNGNGSDGNSTAKKTPQFQDSVTLIGSLKNIYDGGTTSTNDLLAADLKNNADKLLKNSSDLGNDIKVSVNGDFSNSKWTGEGYSTWQGKDNISEVYYPMNSNQFNISSLDDLYDQLTKNISNIFKTILGETNVSGKTYKLTENKKCGIEGDLLHVSITETTTSNSSTKTYDLAIPVSDINLSIDKCSVTVSGDNIVSTTQEIPITYNIGIDSKSTYEGPADVKTIESEASADSIMTALGLKDTTSKIVSQQSFTKITKDGDIQTDVKLNSEKLGQTIGIFNTTFSNTKVELDNSATQAEGDSTSYLTYKVSFDGTPNENYYWDDGTNSSKPFSFNVKVNQKIATVTSFTMLRDASFKWEHAGVDINTTNDANITSTDTNLEKKLGEFATNNTDNQDGIQKMLDDITKKLVDTKVLVHAHVKLLNDPTDGYIRYAIATTGGSSKTWQIRLTAEPDIGYSAAKDQSFNSSSLKAWFDLSTISK